MNPIWKFLSGKKTIISSVTGTILTWVVGRGYVDAGTATVLSTILTAFTGLALGHKAVKRKDRFL